MLKKLLLFCLPILPVSIAAQSLFDSIRVAHQAEVYFAFGKYDLTPEANQTLDSLVLQFKEGKRAVRMRITAHTDSIGTTARNQALSENRARAVRKALEERGVTAEKIEVTGYGATRPVAENQTEVGRQHNRRATVELLFSIPMTDIKGRILDKKTGNGIEATVIFSYKERKDSVRTDTTGYYRARVPAKIPVQVEAYAPNYFFNSAVRMLYGTPEQVKASSELALTPAKEGESMVLNNLLFVGNQAVLLKTSEPELPRVLRFMQINPDLKIEIAGHVNPALNDNSPGELKFEQELSDNRAKLVYDFLIKNGIPAPRLRYKGYSRTKALYPHPTNTRQAELNRRVEIQVLK